MNHPIPRTPLPFFSHPASSDPAVLLGRAATADELEAARRFPCLAPDEFLAKARRDNPADPLLAQVVPDGRELRQVAGFVTDPLGEETTRPLPGLLRRFQGRALLLVTAGCAIHCRYCFRRHLPLHDLPRQPDDWQPVLAQLAADPSLHEVILSGGDPLTLPNEHLYGLIQQLAAIPHLKTVRVHSRMAVVVPARVGDGLIHALTASRLQAVMMVHVNHGAELGEDAIAALHRMAQAGILLYNQSVLLAGINDRVEILAQLSLALVQARVTPCYLHLLDPVAGAAHFQVAAARGGRLIQHLRRILPGYAVPRLAREIPERGIKKIISA